MVEEHKATRELYDLVTNWDKDALHFSKTFGWERWGLFGVLVDYVLWSVHGCVVEVGPGESSIFLTLAAEKYCRQTFHCDIQSGVIENYNSVKGYFKKDAVFYKGPSDEFFRDTQIPPIALAFIDGGHMYEQVKRDFDILFNLLVDNGYIFLHDTYPPGDDWLHENACGTGYKFRQELQDREDVDCFTFVTSAQGVGLTMIRKKAENLPFFRI